MDPTTVAIILIVVWILIMECNLLIGLGLFLVYITWYPDEEPKEPEVTPVVQEVQVDGKPKVTKELCEQQGNIWMYDECIK